MDGSPDTPHFQTVWWTVQNKIQWTEQIYFSWEFKTNIIKIYINIFRIPNNNKATVIVYKYICHIRLGKPIFRNKGYFDIVVRTSKFRSKVYDDLFGLAAFPQLNVRPQITVLQSEGQYKARWCVSGDVLNNSFQTNHFSQQDDSTTTTVRFIFLDIQNCIEILTYFTWETFPCINWVLHFTYILSLTCLFFNTMPSDRNSF